MKAIKQHASWLLALFGVVVGAFAAGAVGAQTVVATIPLPVVGPLSSSNPGALAVNAATNRVYVVDGDLLGASVRVIDGATNKVITTIAIDPTSVQLPVGDIAVDTALNRIYVSNRQTNTLAVIDGATNTVLAKVPVGRRPDHIAVNTHTHRVYTANFTDGSVTAVDGATATFIATIPASAGSATPAGASIAVDEDADRIYVGGVTPATVSVIDGASNAIVHTVATGGTGAVTLAVNKSLHKAYAANFQDKTVAVIDGVSFATTSLPTGRTTYSLTVNLATNRVYIAGIGDGIVTVIDGPTDTVVATVPIGNSHAVAANSVTNQIFLPNRAANNVTVIEGSTNTVLPPVPAGSFPDFIAINEATNRIYVANTQGGSITVIAGGGGGTPAPVRRHRVLQRVARSLLHHLRGAGDQRPRHRRAQGLGAHRPELQGVRDAANGHVPGMPLLHSSRQGRLAFLWAGDGRVQRDGRRASRFRPRRSGLHADVPAGGGRVSGEHDRGVSRVQQPGGCQSPVHDRRGDPGSDGGQGLDDRRRRAALRRDVRSAVAASADARNHELSQP